MVTLLYKILNSPPWLPWEFPLLNRSLSSRYDGTLISIETVSEAKQVKDRLPQTSHTLSLLIPPAFFLFCFCV